MFCIQILCSAGFVHSTSSEVSAVADTAESKIGIVLRPPVKMSNIVDTAKSDLAVLLTAMNQTIQNVHKTERRC
jgi:hypothetical protein